MERQPLYKFSQYQFDPAQKILLRDETCVLLNPKNLWILLVLMEVVGRVVSKDELIAKVWPDVTVEESNLTKNFCRRV